MVCTKVFLVFTLSVVGVSAKLLDYYNEMANSSNENSDWMSRIPNSRQMRELSIPGTHNSVSFFGGYFGQCQSLPLPEQFKAGVRFLDIRCRHANNDLPIFHGIAFQFNDFDGVLNQTVDFLNQHPEEVVFMRIRQESTAQDSSETMLQTVTRFLGSYPRDRFWHSVRWPTLREARGKIVILQNFDTHRYVWVPYNSMSIDDHWDVSGTSPRHIIAKFRHVRKHLQKSASDLSDTKVHLTYSSGASLFAFPFTVAKRMNKRLWKFFRNRRLSGKKSYGMIGMDFPGDRLINQIIDSNFQTRNSGAALH